MKSYLINGKILIRHLTSPLRVFGKVFDLMNFNNNYKQNKKQKNTTIEKNSKIIAKNTSKHL